MSKESTVAAEAAARRRDFGPLRVQLHRVSQLASTAEALVAYNCESGVLDALGVEIKQLIAVYEKLSQ